MKLFSYVVARDYGFAPNPFYNICTLATCKPKIRETAKCGDWIIGTGSKRHGNQGKLVFAMCVSETLTFNEYWFDPRFRKKRPNPHGSLKQAYGDNIYYKDACSGRWYQANSHHSYEDGSPNLHNVKQDTQVDQVLVGIEYTYWGGSGPHIHRDFRDYCEHDVCAGRNHKCIFPDTLVSKFVEWLHSLDQRGYLSDPLKWKKNIAKTAQ